MKSPKMSSKMFDIEAAKSPVKPGAAAVLEGGVAEAVIGGALLRVAQALVGLVDFLELDLGGLVAGVAVGWNCMASLRKAAFSTLSSQPRVHAEDFVEIALGSFAAGPTPIRGVSAEVAIHGMRGSRQPTPTRRATALRRVWAIAGLRRI